MTADPALALRNGLLSEMPPVQALVMMQLYFQLPQRWDRSGKHGMFFFPDEAAIRRTMRLKAPVYYAMVRRLVDGGYIERRHVPHRGMEYRICFARLERFLHPMLAKPGSV
ncbi:MAG: hypothetical protein PHS14_10525 [Elusimicrobia bacterium]|nr:hypothetical protein [Elusimicrobiota bacterium]